MSQLSVMNILLEHELEPRKSCPLAPRVLKSPKAKDFWILFQTLHIISISEANLVCKISMGFHRVYRKSQRFFSPAHFRNIK